MIKTEKFSRRFGMVLSILAIFAGIATYGALTQPEPWRSIFPLLYVDIVLLLFLLIIVMRKLVALWTQRRQSRAGSQLHAQIVGLFSFVTVIPAICVAIFSALFIHTGIQFWFSEPVRLALDEAQLVSEAYLHEHAKSIKHDAVMILTRLAPQIHFMLNNPDILADFLSEMSDDRGLSELMVLDGAGRILARSQFTFAVEFERIFQKYIAQVQDDKFIILTNDSRDRVRALLKIDSATNTYLYLGKAVDKSILKHVEYTQSAVAQYNKIDAERSYTHMVFIALFVVIVFLLLLVAIWAGLSVANLFVRPISSLIDAAQRISEGDLSVHVNLPSYLKNNELGHFADSFNQMTAQLHAQRQYLIDANSKIDQRRQFMEMVLARISAGVMTVNVSGLVLLTNTRATEILTSPEPLTGISLKTVSPEVYDLFMRTQEENCEILHKEISVVRKATSRTLKVSIVRNTPLETPADIEYIITFDDVTPLITAQRKAAWSDVARRIAHEIKNPLTPIQLSAERLKRKYLKEISTDPDTFQQCIDTIIRQVGAIGRLVGEFSAFARMPEPIMALENIVFLCRDAITLQCQAHPSIVFEPFLPEKAVMFSCDAGQISQVLNNLLQNSINSMEAKQATEGASYSKKIVIRLSHRPGVLTLQVDDNGPGFPKKDRDKLLEPYVTTHAKGTGLGLAIVAKIVEDHRGTLDLEDNPTGGARVILNFFGEEIQ